MTRYIFLLTFAVCLIACSDKPKVIVADAPTTSVSDSNPAIQPMSGDLMSSSAGMDNSVHRVVADDILHTDKYTYLHVTENNRKFWIATNKFEAAKGKAYIYRGGLLKTNFESREFKRNFDTLYLVSSIMDEGQHPGSQTTDVAITNTTGTHQHHADAVKIADLFSNKKKFEGQEIIVEGNCTKVNNGIMGRNWVHISDGSKINGKPAEITVTTQASVDPGEHIAVKGKVVLNKDFGAGYRYEIILEEGQAL